MKIIFDNELETKERILQLMDSSSEITPKMIETFIRFRSVFVDNIQDGSIKLSLEDSALLEAAAQHLMPFEKAVLKVLAASIDGTITFAQE